MKALTGLIGSHKAEVPCEVTQGDPQDALTLISFAAGSGSCSSLTPFGTKIETLLRMADLPFDAMIGDIRNPKHAPKHKFPVLKHGSNLVSDSSFITEYLFNTYPQQMAPFLVTDPTRRAVAHAVKRMLEESFYFLFMYQQWQVDQFWAEQWPKTFEHLPAVAKLFVPGMARSSVLRDLAGQGAGRLHFDDVLRRADRDLEAVAAILGDFPYLTGPSPCEADCTLFAILEQVLVVAGEHTPLGKAVKQHPNLVAFHGRIRTKYYEGNPSKFYPPSK